MRRGIEIEAAEGKRRGESEEEGQVEGERDDTAMLILTNYQRAVDCPEFIR